jgi:hypothetical protein
MLNFISQHQVFSTFVATIIFNAAVSSMPSPNERNGPVYVWFFGFTHALLLNFGRLAVNFAPNSKLGQYFENDNGVPKSVAGEGK